MFFYLKLLYEANSVQHRNVKFTSFQPLRAHYNPTIIYFTTASKNLTQFVKVLLVKLSEMLHSSNFVRLFHRQRFSLYGKLLAGDATTVEALARFSVCGHTSVTSGVIGKSVHRILCPGDTLS